MDCAMELLTEQSESMREDIQIDKRRTLAHS
nr:unnamed protein product [Callosobruchus chinensis]